MHVLQTDDTIEPDSAEFPGLAATGTLLCQRYLNDRDKDVRLYSLLACMEILGIVRLSLSLSLCVCVFVSFSVDLLLASKNSTRVHDRRTHRAPSTLELCPFLLSSAFAVRPRLSVR